MNRTKDSDPRMIAAPRGLVDPAARRSAWTTDEGNGIFPRQHPSRPAGRPPDTIRRYRISAAGDSATLTDRRAPQLAAAQAE
jgi:hypothetical protein